MASQQNIGDESARVTNNELISRWAEVFRSKMVREFNLLQTLGSGSLNSTTQPYLSTGDVMDERRCSALMITEPSSLIKFQVHANKARQRLSPEQRRLNRVRNKNSIVQTYDVIAHKIVNSKWFNIIVVVTMFVNVITAGIEVELDQQFIRSAQPTFHLIINIVSLIAMSIFTLETVLKLCDNFRKFWTNYWNIFDLFVTLVSLTVEILKFVSTEEQWRHFSVPRLASFRVLRSVKLIELIQPVQIILMAVARAGRELILVTAFCILIAYIYAVFGVAAFDYSTIKDTGEDLQFPLSFNSVLDGLQTVFQIATNDHWIPLIAELSKTNGGSLAPIFVGSWLFLGSYLLISLVTGSLVSSYTSIRMEISSQKQQQEAIKHVETQMNQLVDKLDEESVFRGLNPQSLANDTKSTGSSQFSSSVRMTQTPVAAAASNTSFTEWQKIVEDNLSNLAIDESTFYWPADTLFQYYLAMEALQENLEERQRLLHMMTQLLLSLNDT